MSRPSPSLREWWIAVGVSAAIVALTSLPYLYGFASEPSGYHFTGLLINPYDGNSYLAKMEIGRRGGWLFHLPFTAEPGTGVPLYFLYIFLGHAAAWVGAPSILIFHMARALAGFVLLLTLFAFVARFFEMPGARWAAWLVIALGSGFGWLAVPFGGFTSDLWVAEAIVFLSIFANPHFPLSIALTLALYLLLIPGFGPPRINWRQALGIVLAATAIAHLQPFASVTIGGVTAVTYAAHYYLKRDAVKRDHVARFVVFALASLPWLIYDFWLSQTHPQLKVWSAQNQTPSPPAWDYLITFGLPLLLAIPGAWHAFRRRTETDVFLLAWLVTNAILLYAPFALQRRLSLGLSIPIGILAAQGLVFVIVPWVEGRAASRAYQALLRIVRAPGTLRIGLFVAMCLPSNGLVLLASLSGIATRNPFVFLTTPEYHALRWIDANTPQDSLVIASPQMGLFIPSYTLRRVIYGHPYETVNAESEKRAVTEFYSGALTPGKAQAFLKERGVDYVMVGPREAALGAKPNLSGVGLTLVFQEGDVAVYRR